MHSKFAGHTINFKLKFNLQLPQNNILFHLVFYFIYQEPTKSKTQGTDSRKKKSLFTPFHLTHLPSTTYLISSHKSNVLKTFSNPSCIYSPCFSVHHPTLVSIYLLYQLKGGQVLYYLWRWFICTVCVCMCMKTCLHMQ